MQFVTLSPSYEVYGNSFLPHGLIQDAGIVAQDVYSSESVGSFLKGSLRAEKKQLVSKFPFHNQVDPLKLPT